MSKEEISSIEQEYSDWLISMELKHHKHVLNINDVVRKFTNRLHRRMKSVHSKSLKTTALQPMEHKCPKCDSELRFDVCDSKYHCKECNTIWTIEFNTVKRELIFREWAIAEEGTALYYGLSAMLKDMED